MRRAVTIAVAVCFAGGGAFAADKAVVWPAGEIKWVDNPAMKGAKVALLWGDPAKGAYGVLRKVPGGTRLELHTHSQDQRVVTITGAIELGMDGQAKKEMTAGSYSFIPAGVAHEATCKAGADCVYFEEAAGPADFKPATKK